MSSMSTPHLWQGSWLSDDELEQKLPGLAETIQQALKAPFEVKFLLDACDRLSTELSDDKSANYLLLERCLKDGFQMEESERSKELKELAAFLSRKDLEVKLSCELGQGDQFNFRRTDSRKDNFEKWAPLGFLVHVAPTNAYSAGAWSVLEGLLSGNVNFLKTGGSDEIFAQLFLKSLIEKDSSGSIAARVFACRISSRHQDLLASILAQADGVIVWGDEGAIKGIKALAPVSARFIEWGPKISFAYFSQACKNDVQAIEGLARECCRMEQQACSSPQCVYLETESNEELFEFGKTLAAALEKISPQFPAKEPGPQEQAEITSVLELCRLESCLDLSKIIEAKDGSWRVLVDYSPLLKASPLYRTIWVKPIDRSQISEVLSPFRFFLQTAGLACRLEEIAEISDALVQVGVLRITKPGLMLESYSGEPHDGVYALQRYSKRISAQRGEELKGIGNFAQLRPSLFNAPVSSIMSKEDFQSAQVAPEHSELFFKSGGSTGAPKLSIFTYDDYHLQMSAAADGLLAAGLEPGRDRCMNLFFAGGLYGGFVSFFTILETLKAVQYPMAGHADLQMVAETIVGQKCNVLLGMPSYIIQLFAANSELFAKNQVVEKIFYGGEHFNESQKRHFQQTYGVKIIRSGGYGGVDAGPIAYQCEHCVGAVHHLHSGLHVLEILELEKDKPASLGEPGRVIVTCLARSGQEIKRYEIGDLARILVEPCPCGRRAQRFELLGRHGDVFRIGSAFFNYGKFAQILTEEFDYAGELQIVLRSNNGHGREEIDLLVSMNSDQSPELLLKGILDNYADLHEIAVEEKLLDLKVTFVEPDKFQRTPGSGKLRRIIDERTLSTKL